MGYCGGVLWWGIVVGYWHRGIVTRVLRWDIVVGYWRRGIVTGVLRWDIVVGYCGGVSA